MTPGQLRDMADDFADSYGLDKSQRDKLRELLQSMPALLGVSSSARLQRARVAYLKALDDAKMASEMNAESRLQALRWARDELDVAEAEQCARKL